MKTLVNIRNKMAYRRLFLHDVTSFMRHLLSTYLNFIKFSVNLAPSKTLEPRLKCHSLPELSLLNSNHLTASLSLLSLGNHILDFFKLE